MGIAPAEKTLSVTHSRKSASELRKRLRELGVGKTHARTYHSEAIMQLDENWNALADYWQDKGYRREFPTVITETTKAREENQYWIIRGIIMSVIKQADLFSQTKREFDNDLYQAVNAELILTRARMVSVQDYEENFASPEKIGAMTKKEFAKFYKKYAKSKLSNNQIDYADVLELCIIMLQEKSEVLNSIKVRYDHFLVDEYQDNDPVQDRLLSLWIGSRKSICVVGDPRQTIYSFKGSEPALLNDFGIRYPDCVTVELNRNYRSTPQIVTWANRLMSNTSASGGAKSDLISMEPPGPEPKIIDFETETFEQKQVAEKVKTLLDKTGIAKSEVAILVRINSTIPIYRQSLKLLGIPSKSPGDTFWEDVLPIMKILQTQKYGDNQIDGMTALHEILSNQGWTIEFAEGEKFNQQKQQRLDHAGTLIALAESLSPDEASAPFSLAKSFAKMREDAKDDHSHNAVTVTSIHKAKGLEWDAVVLPKFVEGLIPISYAKETSEIDEERRLAYVAITRARKYLLISWGASYLNSFGKLKQQNRSRFLSFLEEPKPTIDLTKPEIDSTVYNKPKIRNSNFKPLELGDRIHSSKHGLGRVINFDGSSVLVDFGSLGKKTFDRNGAGLERI
jgi:DNA helicase-2/ATP-dependent DNA helicase PcrA